METLCAPATELTPPVSGSCDHTEGTQEVELTVSFRAQSFGFGKLIHKSSQAQQKGEYMWPEPKTNNPMLETNFFQLNGARIISQR